MVRPIRLLSFSAEAIGKPGPTNRIISQEWRHDRAWGSEVERVDAPDWPIIEIAARYH